MLLHVLLGFLVCQQLSPSAVRLRGFNSSHVQRFPLQRKLTKLASSKNGEKKKWNPVFKLQYIHLTVDCQMNMQKVPAAIRFFIDVKITTYQGEQLNQTYLHSRATLSLNTQVAENYH